MKYYRKILRIPWTAKESNENIKKTLNIIEMHTMKAIKKQKLTYFGHVKRHDSLERQIMEGAMEGKRERGRPRRRWAQDVSE